MSHTIITRGVVELHVIEITGGVPILWWQIGAWSCAARCGEA